MSEAWNSLWKNYQNIDSISIMNEPGSMLLRSEFIGILLEYFDLKNKSILDVGTGTGQYCIELAFRGAKCIGIDKDPESIKLAYRIAGDYHISNCVFQEIDLFDFKKYESKDENYDIVFSMGLLEHFDDSQIVKMLREMSKLGEYVIAGIPYGGSDVYKLSKSYSQKKGTWEYGFERDFLTLSGLFKEAGLSMLHEQVIGLGSEAYYLKRINPELIPLKLSQNLARSFDENNNMGNWLIAIGSTGNKLEGKIPEEGVSIIIPVYNGEKYIEESINNLKKIYYPNLEVIYVDDGSTDNTKMLLEKSPFSILNLKENVGVSKARLEGLKKAKNDYIFFLDIDDLVFPECITKIMRDLKNCPDGTHLSVSCALMNEREYTGDIWFHKFFPSVYDHILSEIFALCGKISLQNTIIRKDSLLEAYKKIDALLKKVDIDRIKIAEDTLLLDIMVFSGLIKHIIPVYYTYRGYERTEASASRQIDDRISDIPIQMAYCFARMKELLKKDIQREKEWENTITCKAIKIYGLKRGTVFVENFKKYIGML